MTTVNQPRVTVNIVNANQTVANTGQKVLIVGQMTSAGTATAGVLVPQIDNSNNYITQFGARAQLTAMIRAFKRINEATRLDVIPLDDAGGSSATELIFTITGTANADGIISFTVGSAQDFTFDITVNDTDTPTIIGDALVAAITANTTIPFTAANTVGVVTCSAANDGSVADNSAIAFSGEVSNVSVALSTTAGGTDPTLTGVLDVIGTTRYQGIVWPYADTTELTTVLDPRFNPTGTILDGVGFVPFIGGLSAVQAQSTENSQSVVYEVDDIAAETNVIGASQQELGFMVSSYVASIRALRMDSSGQSLGGLVISTFGSLDGFGGPALASKPYFNTPLSFVNVNDVTLGYDDTEIESLIAAGASTYGNNVSATAVVLGEMVTTYLTDTAGNPDDTFKFLNYVDTSSQVREYFFNNLRARFAQSRLTEGDTIPGRDMANVAVIQSFCKQLFQALTGADFVLLEAGEDALNFFIENLIITINKQTGTVTIQMEVPLVVQLRVINATLKIAFSVNG